MAKKNKQEGIVVINAEISDPNLVLVLDWLYVKKAKVIVLNDETQVLISSFFLANNRIGFSLEVNGKKLDIADVTAYWYRNGKFKINLSKITNSDNEILIQYYSNYFKNEFSKLQECFLSIIEDSRYRTVLSKQKNVGINKLEVLLLALEIGFNIPNSLIADNRNDVRKFFTST